MTRPLAPAPRSLVADLLWSCLALAVALGLSWRALGPEPPALQTAIPTEISTAVSPRDQTDDALGAARLGDGFVVWESSRGGSWRLWWRHLDGSGLRPLTAAEAGRRHCCPHVSPSGKFLVYLSFEPGASAGELRLHDLESGEEQVLTTARKPSENRVAVWRSDDELIFMGPEGRARRWRRSAGDDVLTPEPPPDDGWLVDATLSVATTGYPTFSPFDAASGRVTPRPTRSGCQPYFSSDGRWGFWVAGAGGPIRRLDFASGTVTTLVEKGDERLPRDRGYLYFPMVSPDRSLLAWGASAGDHSFEKADYDIYVAELDGAGRGLLGPPVRLTRHPATDRFPEVFRRPLELGRHRHEAPWTFSFEGPGDDPWEWDFGDGTRQRTAAPRHRYETPGVYRIVARRGDLQRHGLVEILEPAPPRVLGVEPRGEGRLLVRFDEPVTVPPAARARLASGIAVDGLRVVVDSAGEGEVVEVLLAAPLESADTLTLTGIEDRASSPNRLSETRVEVPGPRWPATERGLIFLWRDAFASNRVPDPTGGPDRAYELRARGLARLDHAGTLRPFGGFFVSPQAGGPLRRGLQRTQRFTLEVSLEAPAEPPPQAAVVLALGENGRAGNLALRQEGDKLTFALRIGRRDRPAEVVELGSVTAGERLSLALTFETGRLDLWRDGRRAASWPVRGDFFHWRDRALQVGQGWGGAVPWGGRLWGIGLWDRVLTAGELAENRRRREQPRPVPGAWLDLELAARSRLPTLAEIEPYDRALAVYRYRVLGPGAGDRSLRVAHWVLLDNAETPQARWTPGQRVRLWLERWQDNPQLSGRYLADTLPPGELYFAAPPPLAASPPPLLSAPGPGVESAGGAPVP